ncbi:FMN-binding negative transcriptional regulator [Roseovarius sp. SCSIO 43702]|uniref:FMN-binding negative transcriptional regulator n=1 Tax=Roseovarius sp. SCSIO 43702 TaxID=2823043 RepID=UPI001C72C8EE|nr:FMN-binding negative transcriptional regulator [Roseovarius sp. SCSIO 43702]QYX57676.1 FMN-binding negative transcriptional regulator [Roseovarius sp. SCSIO 43702]
MHPNPAFRRTPRETNIAFAREQGFGMLAVGDADAPRLSHIPFILGEDGTLAEFHLVRSNPIARLLKAPCPARLAIQGPQGYVSPDWYGTDDMVPTWNYVAVHLIGEVELRPVETLRDLLDRQSAAFEQRLAPKTPWTTKKMTPDVLERMMRQIVPCAMRVDEIEGTWKLGQNKGDAERLSAARHMDAAGLGQEVRILAALMQGP